MLGANMFHTLSLVIYVYLLQKHKRAKGLFTDPLRFEILVGKLDGGVSTSIIF